MGVYDYRRALEEHSELVGRKVGTAMADFGTGCQYLENRKVFEKQDSVYSPKQ